MTTIRTHRGVLVAATVLALALLASACSAATPLGASIDSPTATGLTPSDRYLHVQATELDARRSLDQNAFPQATLDEWPQYFGEDGKGGAAGYYLFMSSEDEWRIGSYLFLPQEITLIQGDRVTMEIFGVRGGEHETVLVGPDGETVSHFIVKRGELHQIEFTADQPGLYQLICVSHGPTMTTNIHVWPSNG